MLHMNAKSDFTFTFPKINNVCFYVLEGELNVNNTDIIKQHDTIIFNNTDADIFLKASENSKLLLMSGEPIDEPLVSHGPFVMTSQTEILEAMRDYQQGKMGFLP